MIDSEDILGMWADFAGFDLDKHRNGVSNANEYDLRSFVDRAKRARDLDPTGMLSIMLIEESFEKLLVGGSHSTTVGEYIKSPESFDRQVDMARRFRRTIAASGMPEARRRLAENIKQAVVHYGATGRDDVATMLDRPGAVSTLWMDALTSLELDLQVHQFMQGAPEDRGTKPMFQSNILGFWTMNDAIRLAAQAPSGISLCLIRDREAVHSYFAFVVRNGANLTVITDKPQWQSPIQRAVAKARGLESRHLEERAGRTRFPYGSIPGMSDEMEGEPPTIDRQEGLVPQQQKAFKLRAIGEIDADQIAWTAVMFALIDRKFFAGNWKAPQLSYTGEMVEVPLAIASVAEKANLPVPAGSYEPLEAERFESSALDRDRMMREAGVRRTNPANDWMVERYGPKVKADLLNRVVVSNGKKLMLTTDGTSRYPTEEEAKTLSETWRHKPVSDLVSYVEALDATDFGTAEELHRSRLYIARNNQARAIEAMARAEFAERKDTVLAWWKKTINKNREKLFDAIRAGKLEVGTEMPYQGVYPDTTVTMRKRDVMSRVQFGKIQFGDSEYLSMHAVILGDYSYTPAKNAFSHRCAKSDRPAQSVYHFKPETADDLATIAGVPKEKLPDVLQHWVRRPPHDGNGNLEWLDPVSDGMKDPWRDIAFDVSIYASDYVFPPVMKPVPGQPEPEKLEAEDQPSLPQP